MPKNKEQAQITILSINVKLLCLALFSCPIGCRPYYQKEDLLGVWSVSVIMESELEVPFSHNHSKRELMFYNPDSFKLTSSRTKWGCRLGEVNPQYGKFWLNGDTVYLKTQSTGPLYINTLCRNSLKMILIKDLYTNHFQFSQRQLKTKN